MPTVAGEPYFFEDGPPLGDHIVRPFEDPETTDRALRVSRGGNWYGLSGFVRSAARLVNDPCDRLTLLGLRLARGLGS